MKDFFGELFVIVVIVGACLIYIGAMSSVVKKAVKKALKEKEQQ